MKRKKRTTCDHALAVHEGHNLKYLEGKIGFREKLKASDIEGACCGGVTWFNYCPFCGQEVRGLIPNR